MKTVKLTVANGKISVQTPYNAEFVTKAKNLGGKWDSLSKSWIFSESVLDYVKEILIQIYGVTGETTYQTCTLVVKNYSAEVVTGAVELFGRTIARASGRDTGVSLGESIVWINGKKESGGSTKYWKTIVENATFEIQNFPFERTKFEDVKKAIAEGWCEIKVTESKRSKEEIKSEIAELKEKLAKLEEELNNL